MEILIFLSFSPYEVAQHKIFIQGDTVEMLTTYK